jgi:hypothetical protein
MGADKAAPSALAESILDAVKWQHRIP